MRPSHATANRGMSLVSTLLGLVVFGFAVITAGRLAPLYLEYQGVVQTLDNVSRSGSADEASVRRLLERGFDTSNVSTIKAADVDISPVNGEMTVSVDYDAVAPFLGNVGFVVHFHKIVTVIGASAS